MNNMLFSNSFIFNTFHYKSYKYTDSRHGCEQNYIVVMKKGHAKLVSNNGTIEISSGDCFFIPINCSYQSYWYGEPEIEFDSFGFTYYPNPDNLLFDIQKIDIPDGSNVLKNVVTGNNNSCQNVAAFYTALGILMKYMVKTYKNSHEYTAAKAVEYIKNHPNCKISDIAKHCAISESTLYNIFQEYLNCTPTKMKQALKIEKAIYLLSITDLNVEAISESCGFSSVIYFRKVFKSVTGKLPKQIRKSRII